MTYRKYIIIKELGFGVSKIENNIECVWQSM